jgi:uncharacterized membrane protein YphA (DoxX/SURF4 family)
MESSAVAGFSLASRFCVGGLFAISALHQLANMRKFQAAIRLYRLLPSSLANSIAYPIALAELAVGVALLVGYEMRAATVVGSVLLVAFGVAIAVNLVRGRRIPCGCNPGEEELISARHVVRNLAMLGMLAIILFTPAPTWSIDSLRATLGSQVELSWFDAIVAAQTAVGLVLIWSIGTRIQVIARHSRGLVEEVNIDGEVGRSSPE